MSALERFLDPHPELHLLEDEGEIIIDEVRKHWITKVIPVSACLIGCCLFLAMPMVGRFFLFPLVIGLALVIWGMVQIHAANMDRFVITNMRVFRVSGIFNQRLATMPMSRILDISLYQPFWGRIFGYGHFVFESAAQAQGLRDIRYVAHPEQRDLTIQRVIQRMGLRKPMQPPTRDDGC
ncbi:MAG: PH domain-containing protein [Propionibacteriaceae bacterium]